MSNPIEILNDNFQKGLDYLVELDRQRLIDQGHVASGRLKNSLKTKVTFDGRKISGDFVMLDYGITLDSGVSAANISYSPNQLKAWAKIVKPELQGQELNRFVFNVWKKHKQEGNPTRASLRFSKTGERRNWIKRGSEIANDKFDRLFNITKFIIALLDESVIVFQKDAA